MERKKSEKEEILERNGIEVEEFPKFPIANMISGVLTKTINSITDSDLNQEEEEDPLRR